VDIINLCDSDDGNIAPQPVLSDNHARNESDIEEEEANEEEDMREHSGEDIREPYSEEDEMEDGEKKGGGG
jgi:hypothetical protein